MATDRQNWSFSRIKSSKLKCKIFEPQPFGRMMQKWSASGWVRCAPTLSWWSSLPTADDCSYGTMKNSMWVICATHDVAIGGSARLARGQDHNYLSFTRLLGCMRKKRTYRFRVQLPSAAGLSVLDQEMGLVDIFNTHQRQSCTAWPVPEIQMEGGFHGAPLHKGWRYMQKLVGLQREWNAGWEGERCSGSEPT